MDQRNQKQRVADPMLRIAMLSEYYNLIDLRGRLFPSLFPYRIFPINFPLCLEICLYFPAVP